MPSKQPLSESIPPTLPPRRAAELLRKQLERLEETMKWRHDDPRIEGWESTTQEILDGAFGRPGGQPNEKTRQFGLQRPSFSYAGMPDSEYQASYLGGQRTRKALLEAYIEQLEILAPPPTPQGDRGPEVKGALGIAKFSGASQQKGRQ